AASQIRGREDSQGRCTRDEFAHAVNVREADIGTHRNWCAPGDVYFMEYLSWAPNVRGAPRLHERLLSMPGDAIDTPVLYCASNRFWMKPATCHVCEGSDQVARRSTVWRDFSRKSGVLKILAYSLSTQL